MTNTIIISFTLIFVLSVTLKFLSFDFHSHWVNASNCQSQQTLIYAGKIQGLKPPLKSWDSGQK